MGDQLSGLSCGNVSLTWISFIVALHVRGQSQQTGLERIGLLMRAMKIGGSS